LNQLNLRLNFKIFFKPLSLIGVFCFSSFLIGCFNKKNMLYIFIYKHQYEKNN